MKLFQWYKNGLLNTKTRILFILATLVYIISPIDLLPDFLPLIGQTDDLIVILGFIIATIKIIFGKNTNEKTGRDITNS